MSDEAVDDSFGADPSAAELSTDFDVTGGDGDVGDDSVLLEDSTDAVGPGGDAETVSQDGEEDAELAAIKARVQEMEAEAEKLKAMQSEVEKQMNLSSPGFSSPQSIEDKMDVDGRSIYIGNVDYGATAEELEQHFHGCGSVSRVTILCDKFSGHPKGFAYVEFSDKDCVETAMALDDSLFRGRQIKVMPKRTNRPGISSTNRGGFRPRGRGRARGGYNPNYAGGGGGGYRPRGRGAFRPRRSTYHYSPY